MKKRYERHDECLLETRLRRAAVTYALLVSFLYSLGVNNWCGSIFRA